VFIGSSSEGKRYVEYLQAALDDYCEAAVWDQGVFGLSTSGLDALVTESRRVDFAVLVLTPDDLTVKRGLSRSSARDNVIFEAGLFVGALGPRRTLIVHAKDVELDLPSDLDGVTLCTLKSQRGDANLRAAVSPAALQIREVLQALGKRSPAATSPSEHPTVLGNPRSEAPEAAPGPESAARRTRGPAQPEFRTPEDLAEYVRDDVVRGWIHSFPAWIRSEFSPDAKVRWYLPGNGWISVKILGKERLAGYFAKRWFFVWTYDRQPGDADWLRSGLSRPEEVKENKDGHLRAHIVTQEDMAHLKAFTDRLFKAAISR
jgi:Predicted nucleotide-binding protein containing TIR-like domain